MHIGEDLHYWTPSNWLGGGGVVGGILVLILSQPLGIKCHFYAIRYIQVLALGLVFVLYRGWDAEWAEEYRTPGLCSIFFLQGAAETMSQILTPVYIMTTVCDRDLTEPVGLLLLINTQLPVYLSSFFAHLLAINPLFMTVGAGVFGGLFFLVFVFSTFLPTTGQDGKEHEKSDDIELWHLQFESECGWLRPGLTAIALSLLSQLSGMEMYEFYASWSLRLAQLPLDPALLTGGVSFFALLAALLAWTDENLPYFLVISTGLMAICTFVSGILLHGLEDGEGVSTYAPLGLHITFTGVNSIGLGPLPPVVAALIIPRAYRLGLFGITGVLSAATSSLCRAMVPVLIQVLHPFGVFWFHSGLLLIGLLYTSLGVVGQIRTRSYPKRAMSLTVEEFVTRV